MKTTVKPSCRLLARQLAAHGVTRVVVSPGSRNAPLVVAMTRSSAFDMNVVIDERSAAFVALGMASLDCRPVALVCTSGTALLNYLPAIAEAWYRHIPLIVVSADRPKAWIGQNDSQTLPQHDALGRFVKVAVDIEDVDGSDSEELWHANRSINHAITMAISGCCAPVHINVHLSAPLGGEVDDSTDATPRKIDCYSATLLDRSVARDAADAIAASPRVMIVAGPMLPDASLSEALGQLRRCGNIAMLCEPVSNLYNVATATDVEAAIAAVGDDASMVPDLLISIGGAIVSKSLKRYLRAADVANHWHIGLDDETIDCFMHLTRRYNCSPSSFFTEVAALLSSPVESQYRDDWQCVAEAADSVATPGGWNEPAAVKWLLGNVPAGWNLQLSNGLTVRMAMKCDCSRFNRVDCNRGVSGIEGSTSTAIGLSIADKERVTLLLSGDMSAAYDVAAFAIKGVTPRFKMVVINNGGGGIFRNIESTAALPELKEYFDVKPVLPLSQLAQGYGFKYLCADDEASLYEATPRFVAIDDAPAILEIKL